MPAAAVVFTLFLVDTIISWNETTHSTLVVSRTGPVYHVCRVTVILAVVREVMPKFTIKGLVVCLIFFCSFFVL